MATGSTSIISNYLRVLIPERLEGKSVSKETLTMPKEIDNATHEEFLHQAGYLSVRGKTGGPLVLGYPNAEVRSSVSALFLSSLLPFSEKSSRYTVNLGRSLKEGDVPSVAVGFRHLLDRIHHGARPRDQGVMRRLLGSATGLIKTAGHAAGLPHPDGDFLAARHVGRRRRKRGEGLWRTILQAYIASAGIGVAREGDSGSGPAGLRFRSGGFGYVIGLRAAGTPARAVKAAEGGSARLDGSPYCATFADPVLISAAVYGKTASVEACVFMKGGRQAWADFGIRSRPEEGEGGPPGGSGGGGPEEPRQAAKTGPAWTP
jgi:hypothetical protein